MGFSSSPLAVEALIRLQPRGGSNAIENMVMGGAAATAEKEWDECFSQLSNSQRPSVPPPFQVWEE